MGQLLPDSLLPTPYRECAEACLRCYAVCRATMQHCFTMGGEHTHPAHLMLMEDCAQICQTSASFLLNGSDRHTLTCAVCAQVCRACADDCARFSGDESMELCAETCHECADHCGSMAALAEAHA